MSYFDLPKMPKEDGRNTFHFNFIFYMNNVDLVELATKSQNMLQMENMFASCVLG